MKKQLPTEGIKNELKGQSAFFQKNTSTENKTVQPTPNPEKNKVAQKSAQNVEQENEQKDEQPFEKILAQLSNNLNTNEIEELAFSIRKLPKSKVNTEIPNEWKQAFDDLAHNLNVGKYELLMYIIADFFQQTQPHSNHQQ